MASGGETKVNPTSVLKTIVLEPSSYPTGSKSKISVNSPKHVQRWHRNGEYCPKGTVPILRSSMEGIPPKNKYDRLRPAFNNAVPVGIPLPEFATAVMRGLDAYGISADMSGWNPKVEANESSSSQVWLTDGGGQSIEAIEAGWIVRASRPHPEIFIYWTVDGYEGSGCYNLDCPGFVLISPKYSLGSQIQPTSTYGGKQYYLNFKIYKDFKTGNWWLQIQDTQVGYWPAELFESLKKSAVLLEWGGRVINTSPRGNHTTTQMGSGSFPGEGRGKAAWFENLEFVDADNLFSNAADLEGRATRPECYDVKVKDWDVNHGASFLYGGPGFSPACSHYV
ncbi:hypothetical protein LINGRAHAP2_LOCUS12294 [Linum grandiflorum]